MSNKRIVIVGRIRTSFVSFTTSLSDWRKSKFENIWKYLKNNRDFGENGPALITVVAADFYENGRLFVVAATFSKKDHFSLSLRDLTAARILTPFQTSFFRPSYFDSRCVFEQERFISCFKIKRFLNSSAFFKYNRKLKITRSIFNWRF